MVKAMQEQQALNNEQGVVDARVERFARLEDRWVSSRNRKRSF